jgi:hypothetical protein
VAEVIEDPINHAALRNERDDPHLRAARRAPERIDFEDLPEEFGPAAPRLTQRAPNLSER